VDGRNEKPLANQRLLVFLGRSPELVRQHSEHTELTTDKEGLADLTVATVDSEWIQVWVDHHVLCQREPNTKSFSVSEILSTGVDAPNSCSSEISQKLTPGRLIVFARPASVLEKMRQ
jgi:hypothetical protein